MAKKETLKGNIKKMSRKELEKEFAEAIIMLGDLHEDYDRPDHWTSVAKTCSHYDPEFRDVWNEDEVEA